MEIIRGIHNLRMKHQECVATIGNFDGMHLGHQRLLQQLIAKSEELDLPSLVIIFEPQPNEYFSNQNIPRLMRFREKIAAFKEMGIDRVLCIKFNQAMAVQIAEIFVRTILIEKLAVKYVLVGDDFHFGYKRLGNYNLLKQMGDKYHFKANSMNTFELLGERVSSTRVRLLLESGDMEGATALLGHPFSMQGKIAHGDKRGRLLGCPTANIHLHRKVVPLKGVFAVKVSGIDKNPIDGVANIGTRPTVRGESRTLLEVHLLNFNRDIYGRKVEINFLHKFRDEKKFATLEELKDQIANDIHEAEQFHNLQIKD